MTKKHVKEKPAAKKSAAQKKPNGRRAKFVAALGLAASLVGKQSK